MIPDPGSRGPAGFFITFEGVEGAGKTTRSLILADRLRERGMQVVHTREPGGPPLAEKIRHILLDPALEVPPAAELMLYLASRASNVEQVVRPALAGGRVVICERYNDATLAYQTAGRGLDRDLVEAACSFATGGLDPDLTLLLDLDPAAGMARLGSREGGPDRIELEDLGFHERVRREYLSLAAKHGRFRLLDAALPGPGLDDMILEMVEDAIRLRGTAPTATRKV